MTNNRFPIAPSSTDVFINVAHGSCYWRGNWIVDDVYGNVPDTAQTTVPEKTAVILIQRDSNPYPSASGRSNVMLGHRSTGIKKRTYPNGRVVNGDVWMVEKIQAMLSDDQFLRNALTVQKNNNNRLAGRRVRPTGRYGKFYYRTYFSGESIPDVSFQAKNNTGLGVYRVNGKSTRKMPSSSSSSYTMKTLLERLDKNKKNSTNGKEWTLLVSFSCLDLRLKEQIPSQ